MVQLLPPHLWRLMSMHVCAMSRLAYLATHGLTDYFDFCLRLCVCLRPFEWPFCLKMCLNKVLTYLFALSYKIII